MSTINQSGWKPEMTEERRHEVKAGRIQEQSAFAFEVDPFRKDCLLNGWDDIGLVLRHADRIREYEAKRLAEQPWLARTLQA